MTSPASVGGDERLRLFLALRLPEHVLDGIGRWQAERLDRVRVVPRDELHVTLAFLGHRPAGELDGILRELREAAAAASPDLRLTPARYRETRSVAMLVLDDEEGRAAALAGDLQSRLGRLGVYRARPGRGSRTSRSPVSGSRRGFGSSRRPWERLFRPTRLLIYLSCDRAGRSTTYSNRSL